jgi:uncharacterized protein YjgD (DUF1641 family)
MSADELVTVHLDADAVNADIVKNALEAEGIQAVLENEMQAGEAGLAALPVKVLVRTADAKRARRIIEHHEKHRRAKT